MKNNLYLRIFGVMCVLVIIGCLFLPFYDYDSMSSSLFSLNEDLNYISCIFIGFGVISLLTLLLNKKFELSYLLVGSVLTYVINMTIGFIDSFKFFGYGYYLLGLSTIMLFLCLIILGINKVNTRQVDDKTLVTEVNNNSINNVDGVNDTTTVTNIEPNDLAKSLMDQPVMNSLSDQVIAFDESNLNNDESLNSNIDNNINIEENVVLAPQNPLNSFLPSDFDPNKTVGTEVKEDGQEKFDNNENSNVQNEDSSNSIMSVMSQPMVNSQLDFSNNVVTNNQSVNNNYGSISFEQLSSNQPVVESSMVQQEINNQPVVEPSMVQPEINNQPVVGPSMVQPEINNQPVVEPSMVQPEINNQPVVEPSISFNNE